MRYILLLFAILKVSCCLGQVDFVILNKQSTLNSLKSTYKILPEGVTATELSTDELNSIKEMVKECIENYNSQILESSKKLRERKKYVKMYQIMKLDNYKIQCVPYLNEKGEKEVWINGFCNGFDVDYWRNNIVYVFDGGNCFFTLRLNISTGKCLEIGINGYA